MTESATHILISEEGEQWSAKLLRTISRIKKRVLPDSMLLLVFEFEFGEVLLTNFNTKLKHGRINEEDEQWYYEVNEQAVKRIKKVQAETLETNQSK